MARVVAVAAMQQGDLNAIGTIPALATCSVASTVAICELIKQYATRFGLTRMSVLNLKCRASGFRDAIICSDAAQVFVEAFDAVALFQRHPLFVHAGAFAISSVPGGIGIDHTRCRSFGDARPAHIDGLIVPL